MTTIDKPLSAEYRLRAKLDPYNRIMEASKCGREVRLSVMECHYLSFDNAISQHAFELKKVGNHRTWQKDFAEQYRTLRKRLPLKDQDHG